MKRNKIVETEEIEEIGTKKARSAYAFIAVCESTRGKEASPNPSEGGEQSSPCPLQRGINRGFVLCPLKKGRNRSYVPLRRGIKGEEKLLTRL